MMNEYAICTYHPRFDASHVAIGIEASRPWIWPYAHDAESLGELHAAPGFDPELWLYALHEDEAIGFVGATIAPVPNHESATATLFFPRVLPGHDKASELLLMELLRVLDRKAITHVTGRVTTMCPQEIRLAEDAGFSLRDRGYKLYYSYGMKQGPLIGSAPSATEIDPKRDMEACSALATRWYKRSVEWCRGHLQARHAAGIIAHLGVRRNDKLIASCLAASNEIRPSTAAIYYIYAPDEPSLRALVTTAANACADAGVDNLIADLIHEHRTFEPVYQDLGFVKVAEWARCEKMVMGTTQSSCGGIRRPPLCRRD
ncbi:hypothetical protein JW848_09885 [Candidatus Bipolaricaulota bacterium]|nr:hypothetical protein [Candidatus Bipolaricaulota bacterium]